ncbi:hypothetical protein EUX98_g1365 [Antrodiella citrinella]|uniref:ARF GTPase-activating protein GIT1 C-terminal domain-containing protein n=1 Tax=Antrodiella citrinella TaxID=2447956 RepID=A0A4S4N4Q7_9APHY|nr:hypothetical protein EUX98_g1365 [Antrodiella citrinella]
MDEAMKTIIRDQLAQLRADIAKEMHEMRQQVEGLRWEVHKQREDMSQQMEGLKKEMTEWKKDVHREAEETKQQIAGLSKPENATPDNEMVTELGQDAAAMADAFRLAMPRPMSSGGETSEYNDNLKFLCFTATFHQRYLESQSEALIFSIQSVLSGVRDPTPPPTMNENITQIVTIVSSVVAVCKDNIRPDAAEQGEKILRELTEHAKSLSEIQASPEVTKEARQIIAKSSFGVANAMKELLKL